MTNIVFVHGAWHGGWCWQKVTDLMNPMDFHIFTPSLTGTGDRAHLNKYLDPLDINLNLHIQDIVQLMTYEDLRDVVLVGHAYAGIRTFPLISLFGAISAYLGELITPWILVVNIFYLSVLKKISYNN